jgi:hypothetical protein
MRGASRTDVFGALRDLDAQASEHGGFVYFSVGENGDVADWSDLCGYEDAIGDVGFICMAPDEELAVTLELGDDRYVIPLEVPGRDLDGMSALRSPIESRDGFLALKALDGDQLMPALGSLRVEEEMVSLRFPDRTYFVSAAGWRRALADWQWV